MEWTKEAEELLKKVPFFVRKKVKREVEKFLSSQGKTKVTKEDLLYAKKVLLKKLSSAEKGYEVTGCFGESCPNSIINSQKFIKEVEKLLEKENLTEFLIKKTKGDLKAHNKFKVGFADCPNACSQIYIMDIAIHAFLIPEILLEKCKLCKKCFKVCEEEAIFLKGKVLEIDEEKCVGCGACVKACPENAIRVKFKGYKVYVGGKLGRHPRLASFLKVVKEEEELIETIKKIVEFYKKENEKGERLGTIIQKKKIFPSV